MLRFPYVPYPLRRPAPTLPGAQVRWLPILSVGVQGPISTYPIRCRLDSGSDDTIISYQLAAIIGIDLTGAPEAEAQGVGGTPLRYPCTRVTLRISDGKESCAWEAIVGFLNTPRKTGLIGIAGFLQYFAARLLDDVRESQLFPNSMFSGQYIIH